MTDFPRSSIALRRRFPDAAAGAADPRLDLPSAEERPTSAISSPCRR